MIFIVYCYPDLSLCTVGKGVVLTFLVIFRCLHRIRVGCMVVGDGNVVVIHAIEEKSSLFEWNKNCRACVVSEVMKK